MTLIRFTTPAHVWTDPSGNGKCYFPLEKGEVAILVARCTWTYNGAPSCVFLLSDGKIVWAPDIESYEQWVEL